MQQINISSDSIPKSIPNPTPTLPSSSNAENIKPKEESALLETIQPSNTNSVSTSSNVETIEPKEESTLLETIQPSNTNSVSTSSKAETIELQQEPALPKKIQTSWEKKEIRGIYLSRYQITNNTDEQAIRERVRYYKSQGINTIIHGVWGNACTMYKSQVMQQVLGYQSCPNEFQDLWLDWLIDEAHKQDMEVHAYFEKGIKIDKNSPLFDFAIAQKWIIPGVDQTYSGVDHYLLDVEVPEVANFFRDILVEFVQKYPQIDAVQWDDYLGYHAELPGKVDRTESLTQIVCQI